MLQVSAMWCSCNHHKFLKAGKDLHKAKWLAFHIHQSFQSRRSREPLFDRKELQFSALSTWVQEHTALNCPLLKFFNLSSRGNYAIDDGTNLLDFATTKAAPSTTSAHDEHGKLGYDSGIPLMDLSGLEGESLGYLPGYVCRSWLKGTNSVQHVIVFSAQMG